MYSSSPLGWIEPAGDAQALTDVGYPVIGRARTAGIINSNTRTAAKGQHSMSANIRTFLGRNHRLLIKAFDVQGILRQISEATTPGCKVT